jgi:hypothetical protein
MKPEELKTLSIGDPITIHAEAVKEYKAPGPTNKIVHPDVVKVVGRSKKWRPENAIYTGWTFRFEGEVHGSRFDDQGYLTVKNTVKVVRYKINEQSNDRFARLEDVEIGHHGK